MQIDGKKVFTKEFLLRRGYCCKSACENCPYDELDQVDPTIPQELNDPWQSPEDESPEVYDLEIPIDQQL